MEETKQMPVQSLSDDEEVRWALAVLQVAQEENATLSQKMRLLDALAGEVTG